MRYNNNLNYRKRKQFIFRLRLILSVLIIIGAAISAYFYFDLKASKFSNTDETTTSAPNSAYFAPSIKVFRSPYFQFQADESWVEVPAESTPNKFVYRSLRSTLIEHDIVVYVNQVPANLSPTRVLPVSIKSSKELIPKVVSEHCKTGLTKAELDRDVVPLTKDKVKINCNSQSSAYNVIVGVIGGDTSINLQRPDGTNAVYTIYYRNLKAIQDSSKITPIVATFQPR